MRRIGHIEDERKALRFSDYLYVRGIENQLEQAGNGAWEIWVHAEERLTEAVELLARFHRNPADPAYDGVEAWDRIKEEKPHLVILDVMMPNKNGYQVCDEMKNNPEYSDITVILLTAVGTAVTSTSYTHWDGKKSLADDYIPKPIDLDKLMEVVKDYTRD